MVNSKMIGNKITEARKKGNISQAQLAELLFISPQAVGKWERGESMPDITTFNRLAEILGVDLNYFAGSSQPAPAEEAAGEAPARPSSHLAAGKTEKKVSWDMSRGNWLDADFSGLKNLHEKFSSSNMQRCLFVGSDLSGLHLNNNNVGGCDFSGSNISGSHIQGSMLSNNVFKDCSLKDTRVSKSFFDACDFSGADFTGVEIKSGGFGNNKVAGTVWNRTSFIDSHIGDTVFEGMLEGCVFENCGFTGVEFQNATLINTFFKNNKKFKKIRFIDCKADKLTYAFLKNQQADLGGIKLITP